MLHQNHVLAWWLFTHPSQRVYCKDGGYVYWYDAIAEKFYCQKESNKIRNGVYEARELRDCLRVYCKRLCDRLSAD